MKVKLTELKSGYSGERRISNLSSKSRAKVIIVGALVISFIFVYILSSVGVMPLDALLLKAKVAVSGNDGRFPLLTDTESTICMDVIGESIVILTTDNLTVYTPEGNMKYSQPHIFSEPGISINGDRAVVFDRGGNGFLLINDNKVVYEGKADNTIISAEYGEDGTYALSTKIDGATSTVTAYNKSNKLIFQWNCAYENIVSLCVSDNGKYLGVATLGAKNGNLLTNVQYFGIDYKEPLNTQTIMGAVPFDIEFTGYNTLTLLTDVGVYTINRKDEKYTQALKYYSSEFNSCDVASNGKYIVSLAKYGSENVFEIHLLKSNGKIKTTIKTDYSIKNVRMSDKYIFALGEKAIYVYNYNGNEVSKIVYKGEAQGILPTDDFIFIVSLDKISRCFSYGNSEIELSN